MGGRGLPRDGHDLRAHHGLTLLRRSECCPSFLAVVAHPAGSAAQELKRISCSYILLLATPHLSLAFRKIRKKEGIFCKPRLPQSLQAVPTGVSRISRRLKEASSSFSRRSIPPRSHSRMSRVLTPVFLLRPEATLQRERIVLSSRRAPMY